MISVLKAETILTQTVGTSAFQVVTSREVKATEMISKSLEKEMKESTVLQLSQEGAGRTLFEIAIYRDSQSLAAIKLDADEVSNLVSLPTRLKRFALPRSPFVHKKSQEHFGLQIHQKLKL